MRYLRNRNRWLPSAAFMTMLYPSVFVIALFEFDYIYLFIISLVFLFYIADFFMTISVMKSQRELIKRIVISTIIMLSCSCLSVYAPDKDNAAAGALLFLFIPSTVFSFFYVVKSRAFLRVMATYGQMKLDTVVHLHVSCIIECFSGYLTILYLIVGLSAFPVSYFLESKLLLVMSESGLGLYGFMYFYRKIRYPNMPGTGRVSSCVFSAKDKT